MILVYGSPVWLLLVLITLMQVLSPLESGPTGVIAIFTTLYLLFASIIFYISIATIRIKKLLKAAHKTKNITQGEISRQASPKLYYAAFVLPVVPMTLIALNTVRQLNFVDILLSIILLVVTIFYIAKR